MFIVYTTEAHAADIWPIGMSAGTINYQHQSIKDRSEYAKKFQKQYSLELPIYLDNMNNDYETIYSTWPFRYHLIKNRKMKLVPNPVDSEFILEDLFQFL